MYGFLVMTRTVRLLMGDTEKDLMTLRYRDGISHWYVDMDNDKDHERIAKEIAKTSDSIRKKYCTLKTDKMEKDFALKRHVKPLNRLSKTHWFQESYYDWNILFGRRRGTKLKRK